MSMKRLTIVLVQLTVIVCLLMVAYTFLLYSGNSENTPVGLAAVSLLSGGGAARLHMGNGIIDGGFVMGASSHPIQRPRILRNHNHPEDGEGLMEMVDVTNSGGGGGVGGNGNDNNDVGGGGGVGGNIVLERYNEHDVKTRQLRDKIERLTANSYIGLQVDEAEMQRHMQRPYINVSTTQVHIFYCAAVPWYDLSEAAVQRFDPASPATSAERTSSLSTAAETTGNRIITVLPLQTEYYPLLGLYTATAKVLDVHFRNVLQAGVGVLVVGWSPPTAVAADETATVAVSSTEQLLRIMQHAKKTTAGRLRVAVELLPYEGRTVRTIRSDLEQLNADGVWTHPAMYRVHVHSKDDAELPMVYVRGACDSGGAEDWEDLLAENGVLSIRRTRLDAVIVGEVATKKDASTIRRGHLNGMYTRAATNGATYASTWKNWDMLKQNADRYNLIFIPTVAPGFHARHEINQQHAGRAGAVDSALRRHRSNGQFYSVAWRTAKHTEAQFVAIASYNDWPAGTQIEEAISFAGHKDYQPTGSRKYLDLTKHWVEDFVRNRIVQEASAAKFKVLQCTTFFNSTVC